MDMQVFRKFHIKHVLRFPRNMSQTSLKMSFHNACISLITVRAKTKTQKVENENLPILLSVLTRRHGTVALV